MNSDANRDDCGCSSSSGGSGNKRGTSTGVHGVSNLVEVVTGAGDQLPGGSASTSIVDNHATGVTAEVASRRDTSLNVQRSNRGSSSRRRRDRWHHPMHQQHRQQPPPRQRQRLARSHRSLSRPQQHAQPVISWTVRALSRICRYHPVDRD